MKASVESLLEPLSAENPCGEDIGYDPQFIELDTLMQGKPETQFAAAEEPDWKAVNERCLELFGRSKDLRVALRLALSLLKTGGLPGFRDGLSVIAGLIERYWEPLYPRLDPDDNNDPLERVNIIASLATPAGTFGDPFQFILRLRQAPIAESPQIGRATLLDLDRAARPGDADAASAGLTEAQISGALQSTPPERLREFYDAVDQSAALVKQIDDLLTRAVGSRSAISFEALESVLKDLKKALAPYAAPGEAVAENGASDSTGAGSTANHPAISGTIRSTQDVVRVLDQVCEFYRKTEPSSPVPLIIQRARRLVNMDFVQLLSDLAPESLTQINHIAGIRPGEDAGSTGS